MAGEEKYRTAALQALWGLSHSKRFMAEFSDMIIPDTFGSRQEQIFAKWCLDHWKKYGKIITDAALEAYMDEDEDFEALDLTVRSIDRIIDSMEPIEEDDETRVYADILELCKRRAYIHAQEEAERILDDEGIDAAFEALDKARRTQPRKSRVRGFLFPDSDRKHRHAGISQESISTGLPKLDQCMDGGLQLGEVAIYVGASGSGKSQWLCFAAAQAMMHGIDCVLYTLELGSEEITYRIEASAIGVSIDDIKALDAEDADPELKKLREAVQEKRATFRKRMARAGHADNKVIIRDLSEEAPSLQTIMDDLDDLEGQGLRPQLVIIDYADLLLPRNSYRTDHEGQTEIHKEMARLAKMRKIAIWTASQVGREGIAINKNSSPLALLGKIQGAFAKVFTATFVVWGAQTSASRRRHESLFLMAKARRGGFAGHHFFVRFDYARTYFRAAEDEDDETMDGEFTSANTYQRDSSYDDPFDSAESEDGDDNEGRGKRRG